MPLISDPEYGLTLEEMGAALANPDQALWDLDTVDCEDSLMDFMAVHWDIVEPRRPFIRGWVTEDIAEHLQAVTRGEIQRLLINVPPGCMKSLETDVFWPAWEWGPQNQPSMRYVCASYSQHLTIRDNLRTRLVMKNERYQRRWGGRFEFSADQDAKVKFSNDKTGFKVATSVSGLGTGERGDRVIVDDPHNVLEGESEAKRNEALQWFTEVLPTRTIDENSAIVVIMQRVHEQDVSGLILEKELGYTHLCLPMHYDPNHPHIETRRSWVGWRGDRRTQEGELLFPELWTPKRITQAEKEMMAWGGTYAVAGQMEQRPVPRGGGMVKADWFEIVDSIPAGYRVKCRGWDFAGTEGGDGAGTASVKTEELFVGGTNQDPEAPDTDLYITDASWDRLSPGQLYEFLKLTVKDDGYDTFQSMPQDPAQAGKYQMSDMLSIFNGYDHEFTLETGEKEIRFRPFAAQAETRFKVGRKIKLVRSNRMIDVGANSKPWWEVWLDHVTKFPKGTYKDIPDAQSRSYGGIVKRGGGMFLVGGSVLITHKQGAA